MTEQPTDARKASGPRLLSGGNPQIAKGDGDAPVQAYIAAMPGWTAAIGRHVDALVVQEVPDVRKAVRWNSPFYGSATGGWFLSLHVLTRYVKLTFFDGLQLDPPPPGGTAKSGNARWLDVYEKDTVPSEQIRGWIRQAAALPGWKP
jgi:hypothetical protein